MNMKKVLKIFKIVGSVIFYAFIVLVLLFSIANLQQKNKQSYPNLFGYGFLSVQTNSMNGDKKDSFKAGDLITVKKPSKKDLANLEVGDIITFYDYSLAESVNSSNLSTFLNSHRIVYITENGYFITQGDYVVSRGFVFDTDDLTANDDVTITDKDNNTGSEYRFYETVSPDSVVGIYKGQIDGMGTFMTNLTKPKSPLFLCVIVLPILVFFLLEVFMVIKNILNLNNEKQKKAVKEDKDAMLKELEAQKEAMRQEILAQLLKEQQKAPEVKEEVEAEETTPEEPKQ